MENLKRLQRCSHAASCATKKKDQRVKTKRLNEQRVKTKSEKSSGSRRKGEKISATRQKGSWKTMLTTIDTDITEKWAPHGLPESCPSQVTKQARVCGAHFNDSGFDSQCLLRWGVDDDSGRDMPVRWANELDSASATAFSSEVS